LVSDALAIRARVAALGLLELTQVLENGVRVPYGDRLGVVAAGLALRARRLVRSIVALRDRDEWLEAQILVRTLLDYLITLEWIARDPQVRVLSWWLADEGSFARMADGVASVTGEHIDVPEELDTAQAEVSSRIAAEAAAAGAPPLPNLRDRAKEVGADLGYEFLFRLYSQGGVHPTRQSIVMLIEDLEPQQAVVLHEKPPAGPIDDPYYLAGALGCIALQTLSRLEPGLSLPDLDPVRAEFLAIKQAIDERG
jgi:hypothetical protein